MNIKALKQAERSFLETYPGGFDHPELAVLAKKHKMPQLEAFARTHFGRDRFDDPAIIVAEIARLVSRSSMVSMFEKPKFRDAVGNMNHVNQEQFSTAVYELLHGKPKRGFERFVAELTSLGLAKWTLATVVQTYYRPQREVFIKPTTAKLIIGKLELGLEYRPQPNWDFYRRFRESINKMKAEVDTGIAPNNPAFCGFLMMALK